MGSRVESVHWSRQERQRYREKVQECLDVFEDMLANSEFEFERPMTGMEIELNLVGSDLRPRMQNADVLAAIADPEFQTELARFNIELNVPPRPLPGDTAMRLEGELRTSLNQAQRRSEGLDAHIAMIGILPTVGLEDLRDDWISDDVRYEALNEAVLGMRGEDIELDITGPTGEHLSAFVDSLAPEAACTSVQLHLQVRPQDFPAHWNAAQALSGVQLALGANSPFCFGHRLWAESRIPLFTQAADTRAVELRNQGVRPRVFFGERWVTSIFDLFEENVRYFPALLPEIGDEDPRAVFESGSAPSLRELTLHNGTVYRWNRPIYDVSEDDDGVSRAHLRVENRVLPAGPSIVDVMANAAFYYGAVRMLAQDERPVWSRMSFAAAQDNFHDGARLGLDARTFWPRRGELPVTELVLRDLLPLAHEGLVQWGVAQSVRDRYLDIIEQRCLTGRNGAWWQTEAVCRLEARGLDRQEALRQMLGIYLEGMHSNQPVHTWELPS